MVSGKRQTANGKRETGNGKRETGNCKLQAGNGKLQTANGKRQTANGKRQTANTNLILHFVDRDQHGTKGNLLLVERVLLSSGSKKSIPILARINILKAKIIIPVIWFASWILMAVTLVVYQLKSGKCYYIEENMPMLPFWTYILIVNYILPLAIMSALYITVARKLWFHEIPGQDETALSQPGEQIPKKRVVRMLIIAVVVFTVCWLPLQVFQMDLTVRKMVLEWHPILIYFAYWLSQANSAINPWLYIGLNGKMNAAFNRIIRCRQEENVRRYRPSTSTFRSSRTVSSVV